MNTIIVSKKNELVRAIIKSYPDACRDTLTLQKKWEQSKGDVVCDTACVREKHLMKLLAKFGDALGKPQKLEIIPIGLYSFCHNNATNFCKLCDEFKPQMGYNITSCKCGGLLCMEIHTVIKDKSDNLYDITPDFNKETHKWFVPMDTDKPYHILLQMAGRDLDFHNTRSTHKCKCSTKWGCPPSFEPQHLKNLVKMFNTCQFIIM